MSPRKSTPKRIYEEENERLIETFRHSIDILLVTATEIEIEALHSKLDSLKDRKGIVKISKGTQTYYIGMLGGCPIVHVSCQMGSLGPASSLATLVEAIDCWEFKTTIMVGIAFGMDQKKQKIGDVLVAEAVVSYEPARIGPRSIIQRGIPDRSDTSLFNRFINQPNWTFPVGKSRQAIIRKGLVISGEALIDNIETRSKLSSVYPEAIGGEMEGSGLIAATRNKRIPWILVKGVCDHADGNKSTLKHHRQKLAAAAAVSLCEFTLSSSVRFSDSSRSANNLSRSDNPNSWREALFDVYDVKSDPYYLIRGIDSELQQLCASRDVWVCGPSGCGKTNSLLRTATVLNVELTFIDLSGAAGLSTRDIWRAIYDALCERIGSQPKRIGAAPGIPKIIDACLELLETESHRARLVVFDELPLEVKTFAQFFSTAAGFIVACGNRMPRRKLRFAFSTILNPSDLSIFDGKLKSKCKLVPLPQWSENEVADVLRIINETLPHKLDGQDSKTLLKRVGLSVRDLKRALSEFISFGPTHGWNISLILDKYFP